MHHRTGQETTECREVLRKLFADNRALIEEFLSEKDLNVLASHILAGMPLYHLERFDL